MKGWSSSNFDKNRLAKKCQVKKRQVTVLGSIEENTSKSTLTKAQRHRLENPKDPREVNFIE